MRLSWALLAFLEAVNAVDTYAAVAAKTCEGSLGCKGYYRAFGVQTSPANSSFLPVSDVTGISVAAIGAQVATNGSMIAAKLDVGGFRFKTPADVSGGNNDKGLSFYFGYLGVTGVWDNSVATGAVAGAMAEVVSNMDSIFVYYNNDNQVGFNWNLNAKENIFNVAAGVSKGYDTLDVAGKISLKELDWTPISHTKVQCNSIAALADAPAGCEIHSLTTSGSNTTWQADPIFTLTIRIASQPLMINGVRHGPDYAKFDVTVKYPWNAFALANNDTAHLTLLAFSAGKAGAFLGAARRNADGSDSVLFTANGQTSHYSYTNTATIDASQRPVTTQIITGAQIKAFSCVAPDPCALTLTAAAGAIISAGVTWLEAFGWKSTLTFHSLGSAPRPMNVFWDPTVGAGPSDTTNASTGALVGPSFLVALVALLLH